MPEPVTCGCGCQFEPSADPGKPLICPRCMMVVLRGQGEATPVETAVAVAPEVAPTPPNPWVIPAEPRKPYDTHVEVWLDPARHHLPVRAKLTTAPDGSSLELLLRDMQ